MRRGLFFDLILPVLVFVVPLVGAPERIAHPGPWLGVIAAWVILFTQPALTPAEMVKATGPDRRSALGIYVGMIGPQVAAIVDYGYLQATTTAAFSAWPITGALLVLAGLSFRVWAIRTLGRFFTSTVMVQDGQTVIRHGPYRYLRHPSYTGALTASLGMIVAMRSSIGIALWIVLALPAYAYRISVEERTLAAELGAAYRDYQQRSWRLIPLVY